MADWIKIVETVVTGVAAGGVSGAGTLLAIFRETKKKVAELETKVGTEEPSTGMYLSISILEEASKKMRRELESWEDDPPDWAKRLLARNRVSSSTDLGHIAEVESRVERTLRAYTDRIKRVEDDLDSRIERLKREIEPEHRSTPYVTRAEYLEDSRERAAELLRIRQELATANGLLRGVMSGLGYLELEKPPRR